jgi:hypothetical protein
MVQRRNRSGVYLLRVRAAGRVREMSGGTFERCSQLEQAANELVAELGRPAVEAIVIQGGMKELYSRLESRKAGGVWGGEKQRAA